MKKLTFSVMKSTRRIDSSIQEAVGLLRETVQLLRGNENYIRSEVANLSKILNGPQGNVASKTATSIDMLNDRYDALDLLSYFTLDVKNVHSVVHHKDKLFVVLDYPRNFGNVA